MLLSNNLLANKYTQWSLISRVGFNYNMHTSDKVVLPGICYECFNIENGNGKGLNFSLGIGYEPESDLFGMKYITFFELGYNNLSGKLDKDNFVGNIITPNDEVKQGIIKFELDNSISLFQVSPYVYIYPFKTIPTGIKIGLSAGYVIQKEFSLNEKIQTPGIYYKDGSREKTSLSGDIPNNSSLLLSIPIGVKYDVFNSGGFILSPELNYNLALNNFHSDSKWSVSQFTAGITAIYKIPKTDEPAPIKAPAPKLPEPPIESEITSRSVIQINGKTVGKGSSGELHYSLNENKIQMPLVPYLFFEKDSYKVKSETNSNFNSISLSNFLNSDNNKNEILKIKLIAIATEDEQDNIVDKRLQTAIELLKKSNIRIDKIETQTKIIPSKKLKYPEIAEENRCVYFELPVNTVFNYSQTIDKMISFSNVNADIQIFPYSQAGIEQISGEVYLDKQKIGDINRDKNQITIDSKIYDRSNLDKDYTLSYKYSIKDKNGNYKDFYDAVSIKQILDSKTENINNKLLLNDNKSDLYFIAFNSFDNANPYMINPEAKSIIENAVASGKKVEIYGLTDNLGTEEYNINLSEKRVTNLLKKMGIDTEKITIMSAEKYFFENNSPLGRFLNRSVIMFIK